MRCCLLISSRSGESRSKEESGGGRCWGGKPCINVCCTYPQSQNYLFITLLSSQGDFCQDSTYTLNLASKRTDRWGRFIRCLNSQSYFFFGAAILQRNWWSFQETTAKIDSLLYRASFWATSLKYDKNDYIAMFSVRNKSIVQL